MKLFANITAYLLAAIVKLRSYTSVALYMHNHDNLKNLNHLYWNLKHSSDQILWAMKTSFMSWWPMLSSQKLNFSVHVFHFNSYWLKQPPRVKHCYEKWGEY